MKRAFRIIITLGLIFIVAAAAVFYFTQGEDEEETVYNAMSEATLPVVYSVCNGERINRLYGYVCEMKEEYMRDCVTLLDSDGHMTISVDCYGSRITGISYEVRDTDSGRLIESTSLETWSENASETTALLPIQKLIDEDTDYLLTICLSTEKHENIYYYTRILYGTDYHLEEMIEFVRYFSDRTMDAEERDKDKSELSLYLEPDSTGDNTTLAFTNIHSSHSMLTWESLEPGRISDLNVDIMQLGRTIGTFRLSYEIMAQNDDGERETYSVTEVLVIRWSDVRFYLLSYERRVNQHFTPDGQTVQSGVIDLGIVNEDDIVLKSSPDGLYTIFTADGALWSYNSRQNEIIRLFSFHSDTEDDARTAHDEHDFKIIEVTNDGDVTFMVYGYMNSGSHEGESAMVFYRYLAEDNSLSELFYIPAYSSYSLLRAEMGTLCFISDTGMIYVIFGASIYAIDVVGTEHVQVTGNLREGSCVISNDSSWIAWQEGSDTYSCTALSVMNLADGSKMTVRSADGEYLLPLGFIGGDLVYGIAREADISTDISGHTVFPMYAAEIISETGETVTHYENTDLYIMEAYIDEGRILLVNAELSETGQPVNESTDVLLRNAPENTAENTVLKSVTESRRKKIYTVNMSGSVSDSALEFTVPEQLTGLSENRVELPSDISRDTDGRYFSYAYGELEAISYSVADAINAVYDNMGIVVDAGQNLIWARGVQSDEKRITVSSDCVTDDAGMTLVPCVQALLEQQAVSLDVEEMLESGASIYDILEESLGSRALDLSGCTLQQLLYYISLGHPVIVLTGDTTADLIVGYDNYNVTFYNPLDGTYYKKGRNDTADYLEEMGEYLFSCR